MAGGNIIEHIPAGLEAYRPFIQSQKNVGWVDWQITGCSYAELSESCPFCAEHTKGRKEQIKRVGLEYDKNTIKNLMAIIGVVERLGDYFSETAKAKLLEITTLKHGIEKEHENFLVTVKDQIDTFVEKLERLKTISGFQFEKMENVKGKLHSYKLDLEFFSELDSIQTQQAIDPINASIDDLIKKSGVLQGKINIQRRGMEKVIQTHQDDINNFLAYAGYSYKVEISGKDEQAQLKLLHIDHSQHLNGGGQHLSFGERNAFAIVLFMYECLSKKPDLIILDDPISSFDKNKKYAILEMLFRRDSKACLKNKTVLMLTHDVEPVIEMIKTLSHLFSNQTSASFLKLTGRQIREHEIKKNDIQVFSQICKTAIESEKDDIIKLIYMRRLLEIKGDLGDGYQVLSNLLHKRKPAIDDREPLDENNRYPAMDSTKFKVGCDQIQASLTNFSYDDIFTRISNADVLKSIYRTSINGYEKLQIFRLLELNIENSVIKKFINETYHIENEFICQLDPAKFDTIPEYVINECNKLV